LLNLQDVSELAATDSSFVVTSKATTTNIASANKQLNTRLDDDDLETIGINTNKPKV
jgi:hypothetical protein